MSDGIRLDVAIGALLLAVGTTACASVASPGSVPPVIAADGWMPLPCPSCERAAVSVELQRSTRDDGRTGQYLRARVSNRAVGSRVITLKFFSDVLADRDGAAPAEYPSVALAPVGEPGSVQVILLGRSDWNLVAVTAAERFIDAR